MLKLLRLDSHNSKVHIACVIAVTFLIGVLFYILNFYTPLYADDYSYSFAVDTGERITSASQILGSQIAHYFGTNGRAITHSLAQLFLLLGDSLFNVLNTFFFVALIYLLYFHGCATFKRLSLFKLSLIAILLFLCCPQFGQSFLWITGAANYMYGIFIVLLALVPYRIQSKVSEFKVSVWVEVVISFVLFLLGIIAGWTNENTAVAMIAVMIGYIVLFRVKSIKIRAWNISECLGAVLGCVLMLTAPGNANRLESAGGSGGIVSWIKRVVFYSCDLFVHAQLILFAFVVLFVFSLYINRNRLKSAGLTKSVLFIFKEHGVALIYLMGFFISVYSMVVSPSFPARAWSGPIIFSLVALVCMSNVIDQEGVKVKVGKCVILAFAVIVFSSTFLNAVFELKNVNAAYQKRIAIIETAVVSGDNSVELPQIYGWDGYSCYTANGELVKDSTQWPNVAIAKYYGLDEVNVLD